DGQRGAAAAAAIVAGSPRVGGAIMAESESSNDSAEYVEGDINCRRLRASVIITPHSYTHLLAHETRE
ncbi:hypothetical protein, partial [Enterobacter intestinihominis]